MHESSVPTPSTRRLQHIIRKHVFNGNTFAYAVYKTTLAILMLFLLIAGCKYAITGLWRNQDHVTAVVVSIAFTAVMVIFEYGIFIREAKEAWQKYATRKQQLPDYLNLSTTSVQELQEQFSRYSAQLGEYEEKASQLRKELDELEKEYRPTNLEKEKQLRKKLLKAHEKASGLDLLCK